MHKNSGYFWNKNISLVFISLFFVFSPSVSFVVGHMVTKRVWLYSWSNIKIVSI